MAGFRRFYDIRALVIDGNRVQGFGEVQASLKVIVSTLDSQTLKTLPCVTEAGDICFGR